MSERNFVESHHCVNATTKASDLLAGNLKSDIYNMESWRDVIFTLTISSGDGTGTARVHLRSVSAVTAATSHGMDFMYRINYGSSSSDTWGAWTAATSSGFCTVASSGTKQCYEVWGKSADLYATDHFIMWDSTEIVNDPSGGGLSATFFNGAYLEDVPATVLV